MQELLTYAAILYAVGYVIYGAYRFVSPSKAKSGHNCADGCSGCALKEVHMSAQLTRDFKPVGLITKK